MDGDPPVAADRRCRDCGSRLPFGIAVAWLLARKEFLGQGAARRADRAAAGAAAGRHRLSAADLVRAARRRSAPFLAETFGIVFVISLDRRGAGLRDHGVSAAGAADPSVVRGDRPRLEDAASTLGANAVLALRHRDAAARAARNHRRHHSLLRQGARRIRRHHHLRVEHSRAKRRRSRPRSTPTRRCRAATPRRCGW